MAIEFLIVSNILLWLTVIASATVLLGITRQVGILHERSAPLGAMITDHGPDIGDSSPTFEVVDYFGKALRIGGPEARGRETLLMFTAPTCPICDKLLPIIKSVARDENVNVLLISDGQPEDHARFLKTHDLGGIPYVVSPEVGMRFQVGKIPYGVVLDGRGKIRAKGLTNTREHLESLLEGARTGHHSLQDYMKKQGINSIHANGSGFHAEH
jgi:methylamine dehydrogenase accessory protein MauD